MKQIARWAVFGMAAVAASATLPSFADGEGSATVENDILTLSGLVTNITAEADLGASVTQVVMTAEGGISVGATLTLAKSYQIDGTGVVGVAEGKTVSTPMVLLPAQIRSLQLPTLPHPLREPFPSSRNKAKSA